MAMVTAIGGGTMRDLLLDRHPIFWIAHPEFLLVCLAATALTLLYVHLRIPAFRALFVTDAVGLAFFTVGGVARDVLLAEIPLILRRGQLYASAALVGAALYLLLERAGVPRDPAALAGMATIALVRFAAILWRLELPVLTLEDQDDEAADPR
jgi:uncharacterized membrane protein YeiH